MKSSSPSDHSTNTTIKQKQNAPTKSPVNGLLLATATTTTPTTTSPDMAAASLLHVKQHRRVGSTGTTGDESCTTDDEDDNPDETDCSATARIGVMHRNSSDSSVYSDLGLDSILAYETAEVEKPHRRREDDDDDDVDENGGWARGVVATDDQAFVRLKNELKQAQVELKMRDEEVGRLTRIRQDVETELEELTASLFQEAHNMVREANEKQAAAERALTESQMKVDVLTAEVTALKTLVLTSTPSRPNVHLHPQIDPKGQETVKKHHRSPSHFNLKYGRENSPPDSPVKETNPIDCVVSTDLQWKGQQEVDPDVHGEFMTWKANPTLDKSRPFIKRIYEEDIDLCLRFNNAELSQRVTAAVETGCIFIEAAGDRNKVVFPKKCALLEVPRLCYYRMNIGEPDVWYSISQICRNRIIAVCDFLNYLKYIERGLVKSSAHDVYWEIARLRRNMVLARLGLSIES